MRGVKIKGARLVCLAALAVSLAPLGCSSDTTRAGQSGDANVGNAIGLALQLAPGTDVSSVSYAITGPAGFTKSGSIDVSASPTITAAIGGLPAGVGFSITLNATSSQGGTTCSGSASFDVLAHQTTPVAVHLLCHEAARTGSVLVNGVINVCPSIDGIGANPDEVFVGSAIALSASARDVDQGPSALSYHWIAVGGTLSDANVASPQFTCTLPGVATATLTVSDGDNAPNCADTSSVTIACTPLASGDGGAANGGAANGGGGAANGGGGAANGGGGAANGGGGAANGGGGAANGGGGAANGGGGAANGGGGAANGGGGAANGGGGAANGGAANAGAGGAIGTVSDVVVYRVGDGQAALASSGNPVFVDEYSPSGVLVRATAMPTVASGSSHRLVASGTATSEGFITRSGDGRYLVLTGYDSAIPAASSLAGSASATTPRTIARLGASGDLDTTTALTDAASANNPRSATSSNGVDFWFGGASGGVRFATLGGSTSVQLSTTVANVRQVAIFGAQLFVSDASGSAVRLGSVGSGLPTTAGQIISNLPGTPAATGSPYGYFFADLDLGTPGLDVLYVADDSAGVTKYSLIAGAWTAEGTIGSAADAYRGLTGTVSPVGVTLYATRKGGSGATGGGELVVLVDPSGHGGALTATPSLLATAATNTAFRGVALAPTP